MKLKQLTCVEGQRCVRPASVIAEFDLVNTRGESFDNRADLAAQQAVVSYVFE
jgi:hypothetical protein